jgi:3-hydroxyacyl-CoA dehydrogenase/enoyl-CoA hydratase/3-hydroxybutyryl-CoA epimerase
VTQAFHLAVDADGLATLTFDAPGRSVNVFDQAVLEELETLCADLGGRTDIAVLVLLSGKDKGFIAGADLDLIAGVEDPALAQEGSRYGQRVFAAWEALPFPTVAAIRGVCLGGGTELALASTYRVISDDGDSRIGLPEVRLGILPGWGGCTRLPQRIDLPDALDMILTGRNLRAKKALRTGLVDALLPATGFTAHLRRFALDHLDKARPDGGFDWKELLLEKNPVGRRLVFDRARSNVLAKTGGNYPAPLRALEVVRTGIEGGPEAGFEAEARALGELATSPVCKNLIHVFRLTEAGKKERGPEDGRSREIRETAVLGAGAMGGGIAQLLAHEADLTVHMKDLNDDALGQGMEHAGRLFGKLVEKRRLSKPEARRRMERIRPTLGYEGFGRTDLVIEAVVEKMEIKQKVFAEVAAKAAEGAVLASNTSSLSIAGIGAETPNPERVAGLHFFNPVHKMPLVEVIGSETTSDDTLATLFKLCHDLGKTPVRVKDSPGFLVNRLLMFYQVEALWLLDEGYRIGDIDRALSQWGMPVGPMALGDEVGLDVAIKVAHILHDAFPDRLPQPEWLDVMVDENRLGKKTALGYYRWKNGKRQDPDPEVYGRLGVAGDVENPDPRHIVDRMVLPMVDEAARCLDEGIVSGPDKVDLAMILGTGFPPFRGGPCRWADREGLGEIVATLERFAEEIDQRFAPSDALRGFAQRGGFYGD